MKLFVVLLTVCIVNGDVSMLPGVGRPQIVRKINAVNEISLRLQPPALPHDHHHHHHHEQPMPTKASPTTTTKRPTTTRAPPTTKRPTIPPTGTTPKRPTAEIVKNEYNIKPDGSYDFHYETSDGQRRDEVGYFTDDPEGGRLLNVRGSYEYIDSEGLKRVVRYTAGKNGYMEEVGSIGAASLPPHVIASLAG